MFRTVPLSIIRSFSLYTQQYKQVCWQFASRIRTELRPDPARKLSAHIPLLCVQWKSPNDGQRNCPKHVEFYSKNKFEKFLIKFIIKPTRCTNFSIFFGIKLYMFRTVPLSIIRDFSLYTQQYIEVSWQQAVSKLVWPIPLLCVQWNTPDDGQRSCPKHVELYSKNKF